MLPSTMLNLFRWALSPQCPEIILETVVISFLSALHSSNHGLRETLGKIKRSVDTQILIDFCPEIVLIQNFVKVSNSSLITLKVSMHIF
jgi:hypothetical protein